MIVSVDWANLLPEDDLGFDYLDLISQLHRGQHTGTLIHIEINIKTCFVITAAICITLTE